MALSQSMGQSPAALIWASEENACFYISILTIVMEPLLQFPRSYPCSKEDCMRRSGASRAVILFLCWALMKLCLQHVSSVGSPEKEGMGYWGVPEKGHECQGGTGASPIMRTG